jgi:c-di-GMP-binding flagellar brake protein YcgR
VGQVIAFAEKRRWQRLPIPVPMFIRGVDGQGKGFLEFSTTLNISTGGALLVSRRQLPSSSKVSLQIPTPPFPKQVSSQFSVQKLKARVVRVKNADGYYFSGLEFSRPLVVVCPPSR